MEFRILGPLEIRDSEGKQLSLGAGRQRALLAVLLLHANEVVSTDRLIEDLWGERPPETAAKALQGYVSQVRKALSPGKGRADDLLVTRAPGYLLRVEPDQLDAFRFERLLVDGRGALAAGEAREASATLAEALSLWGGPALSEFAFEAFSQSEIKRLEELRLAGLESRIEADLALGRHGEVSAELEALVAQHPLRERLRGQLMLALYRGGRQGEALQQYQRARHVLIDELGLEPSEALQRLQRSILTHDPSLEPPVVAGARNASLAAAMRGQARAAALPARSSRRSGAPLPPNSVALIDLEENQIIGHVPVGWRPVAVAVGHGSVWVANADDGTLSRIDPDSRTVTRIIGIGAPAIDVAIGPDSVWVANGSDGTLSRVDPNTEVVVDTIDLRGENELAPNTTYAVSVDGDAVWVATGPRNLVRIDPATNKPAAVIDVGHIPVSVAVYEGAVWVATVAERALRIEERTQALTAATAVGFPVALAAGEGGIWIVDGRGSVWHIDPDTAAVIQTISVGRGSLGLAAGAGGVWVANNADGTILRIDPSTDQVAATIEVGHAPTDVALGDGVGWVSIQSESAI